MSAAAESEHAGPGEAGRGARVVRRVIGTAWGIGLQADLRPEYGLSDHTVVAFNPVAFGVVVVLGGLLWMRRRALR